MGQWKPHQHAHTRRPRFALLERTFGPVAWPKPHAIHVEHLELRRCDDRSFLEWLGLSGIMDRLRKFIYVQREVDHSIGLFQGTNFYHLHWSVLSTFLSQVVTQGANLESLGLQFPGNPSRSEARNIQIGLQTAGIINRTAVPSLRDIVVLIVGAKLDARHFAAIAALCPNLRDPSSIGEKSAWPRLYNKFVRSPPRAPEDEDLEEEIEDADLPPWAITKEQVGTVDVHDTLTIGNDEWARMGPGRAQYWYTGGYAIGYQGRSYEEWA